jgi:hypothetical protein
LASIVLRAGRPDFFISSSTMAASSSSFMDPP